MATHTASSFLTPVLSSSPGVHVRRMKFGPGITISSGDKILLLRIPNNTTILGGTIIGTGSSGHNPIVTLYVSYPGSSLTALPVSRQFSLTSTGQGFDLLRVATIEPLSLSADAALGYGELRMTVDSTTMSSTTAFFIDGYLTMAWNV